MRPKLTFNDSIWNVYELKDIVSFSKGKNVSLDIVTETGFPAMMYGDIYIKYDTFFDKVDYCIPIELSKDSTIIDKNTILMTCTGETAIDIGKSVCYLGEVPICIGGDILALKCTNNTNAKFLCLQLNTYDKIKERARLSQGHSVVHLYQHHIEKSKIYKPDIAVQTKIATFLNLYYKKIELQKEKIELLDKIFKHSAQNVFDNHDKQINIEELVDELVEKSSVENQYPILSSTMNGIYLQNEYFTDNVITQSNIGYKIVPYNYFTYRSMSDTGKFVFNVQTLVNKGIVSPAYPVFKTNEKCLTDFLYYYLNYSKSIKKQLLELKEGGTRYALGFEKFKNLKVILLPIDKQQIIVNKLNTIKSKIILEKQKLEILEKYKQGLLQQLFI